MLGRMASGSRRSRVLCAFLSISFGCHDSLASAQSCFCAWGTLHDCALRASRGTRIGTLELIGSIFEDQGAEEVGGAQGDAGVVDEGLGVEVGQVGCFGVGGGLGEGDEDLGCPGAVDGVVGLELAGVPGGCVEAPGDEGSGTRCVRSVGDDPEGVEGAEFDHGAVLDGEVGCIGDEGA